MSTIVIDLDQNKFVCTKFSGDYRQTVKLSSKQLEPMIQKLLDMNILSVMKINNHEDLKIRYDKGTLRLNNWKQLQNFTPFIELMEKVARFYYLDKEEMTAGKKVRGGKHAVRSNQYSLARVMAMGSIIAAMMSYSTLQAKAVSILTNQVNVEEIKNRAIETRIEEQIKEQKQQELLENDWYTVTLNPEIVKTIGSTQETQKSSSTVITSSEENIELDLPIEEKYGTDRSVSAMQYEDLINQMANKYMLDPNLVMAIATQERGTHSQTIDEGGGLGLMQIQVNAHPDGSTLPVIVNNNGTLTEENFTFIQANYQTLNGNVEAGCALLNWLINYYHGNVVAAIYGYNLGNNSLDAKLKEYASNSGISYESLVNDRNNLGWVDSLNNSDYLVKVCDWLNDDEIYSNYIVEDNGAYNIQTNYYNVVNTLNLDNNLSR